MEIFGPILSQRLGKCVVINNIPENVCSYSCIYCMASNTIDIAAKRREFYQPEEIFEKVKMILNQTSIKREPIDYLSFMPCGAPTLDINLGNEIDLLKGLGIKIAIFTNASLLLDRNVRSELAKADLVSIKIDTSDPSIWKKINRPHNAIFLESILDRILLFRETFKGRLITETILVQGVNDSCVQMVDLSEYLERVNPETAYLAIPARPALKKTVVPPNELRIKTCHHILNMKSYHVEYLTGVEGHGITN